MSFNNAHPDVENVLNELKNFLAILQDCEYIRCVKFEWELVPPTTELNRALNDCEDTDMKRRKNLVSASKMLVDRAILMEQTLIKSCNLESLEQLYTDTEHNLYTSSNKNSFCYSGTEILHNHELPKEDINIVGMCDPKDTKNVCKYCRRRFATKEHLRYHLLHLHGIVKPG